MIYRIPQKGFAKPFEKQVLNSGLVVICENIVEDTTNQAQTIYTWIETRYTQFEYMEVVGLENDRLKAQNNQLWDTVTYLLGVTGCINVPIDRNIVDNI